MAGPRHGENGWFWPSAAAALLIAAWCGTLVHGHLATRNSFAALGETTRKELAALQVPAVKTGEVERKWVSAGFDSAELTAPVGPRPCPPAALTLPPTQRAAALQAFAALDEPDVDERLRQLTTIARRDPANLLVALITGRELAENGRFKFAEQILWDAFILTKIRLDAIVDTAQSPATPLDLNDDDLATVIHFYHVLGVVQLAPSAEHPPWRALKNPVSAVTVLSRRRTLGMVPGESAESRLTILAPGCAPSDRQSLTSYDVFNNLIVGYMRLLHVDPNLREREFRRDPRQSPSAVRRLFLALVARERKNGWKSAENESRLWALSNADRVLDWQVPDNSRLAFNIVRLLDWWSDPVRCPASICTEELLRDLRKQRDGLVEVALTTRDVEASQRETFARGILQMLADSAIAPASVEAHLTTLREWLPQQQQPVVDHLLAAERARAALPRWVMSDDRAAVPWTPLGPRAREWREAALADYAGQVAASAENKPQAEKTQIAAALRQLLAPAALPPEASGLLPSGAARMWFNIKTAPLWWIVAAVAAASAIWLVIVWVLLQVREYRLLRKSFYDLEFEYIDRIGVSQQPR